jgi:hypothetical protein
MLVLEQLVDGGRFESYLLERVLQRGEPPHGIARRWAGVLGDRLDRPPLLTGLDDQVGQALE